MRVSAGPYQDRVEFAVRIEIAQDELPRALDPVLAAEFTRIFKALGFQFVTLDLEGFRSGSMNAVLPISELKKA